MSRPEPVEDRFPLRAGPLSAELDGPDLVSIRWGATEIASRILVTVRNDTWGTVPCVARRTNVDEVIGGVAAHVDGAHEDRDIKFAWSSVLEMHADGLLALALHGHVLRDFTFRRIGVCVLHPWRTYVGARYRATTPGGPVEGSFPRDIAPQLLRDGSYQPMIGAFSKLHVALPDGIAFEMALEGELFELEDQRNWTDASFKTYPTPLASSGPRQMRTGDRVEQRVTIRIAGPPSTMTPPDDGPVLIRVGGLSGLKMPPVGVMISSDPLSKEAEKALGTLAPAHVGGVVLRPDDTDTVAALGRNANEIGAPLELAILVDEDSDATPLAAALRGLSLARVLVHLRSGVTIPGSLVNSVREQLGSAATSIPVAGGTWSHFSELNRLPPDVSGIDEVAFSISPQVHATDERSMIETLEVQREVLRCARALAGDLPIVVSPVTLSPNEPEAPAQDPRTAEPFGAAWTLGSLANLVPGVASVTYHSASGPGGIVGQDAEPTRVQGVLSDAISLRGSDVLDVSSSRPREVAALAIRIGRNAVLLLANLTPTPKTVDFGNTPLILDGYGTARIQL